MKRNTRARIWLGVIGLCALLMVGVGLLWPRPPQLLARARLACRIADWYQGRRFYNSIDAHWISDREILHDLYEGQKHERHIYRKDIVTGTDTFLPGLTESRDLLGSEVVDDQMVSPDGKWFVCSARWDDCLLASVGGKLHHIYPSKDSSSYRGFYWLPDSRYWIESYRNSNIIHDVQNPTLAQELALAPNLKPDAYLSRDQVVCIEWPDDQVDDAGQLHLDPGARGKTKQVVVSVRPLRKGVPPSVYHELTLPNEVERYNFKLSPDSTRAVWLVTWHHPVPYLDWLHKYLSFVRPVTMYGTSLWIGDLDGHEAHEIGRIEKSVDPATDNWADDGEHLPDAQIDHVRWLPSGNSLSFEYQNALYTVPAK